MKIVLISGMSGVGKTTIAKNLCERYPDKYNFVHSYTDRDMREKDEWGHTFIDPTYMDLLLERGDIVAQTNIDNVRYCTIRNQFDKNKINIYTVDINGINDTIDAFPNAALMTILVRRQEIEGDCVRLRRDVAVPSRDDVDFLIDNNSTIDSSANLLNTLVNFDFFTKPSRHIQTLKEKIDYIDTQCRFLKQIRTSILEQMWYQNLPLYRQLCQYVEKMINNDFDFDISVKPDEYPEILDGFLTYNIQGRYDYDDLGWNEINRLTERLTIHAHTFCDENDCKDMLYDLAISEYWNGEDEYR